MKLASANAGAVADPAVFRVLTDLLRMSPRAEKVELAQLVFDQIDVDVIRYAQDSAAGSGSLILSAWVDAVEVAHGVKGGDDIATLREQARLSLDTRAFELLTLAEKDEAARNRLVSDAVIADIREERPLVGYDRTVNLALPPAVAVDSYLALIHSFSIAGYDNYVKALVELVAGAVKSRQLQLSDGQVVALFRDIEIVRRSRFHPGAGTGHTGCGEALADHRTACRHQDNLFPSRRPADRGEKPIAGGPAATKALQVAASLIDGELPNAAASREARCFERRRRCLAVASGDTALAIRRPSRNCFCRIRPWRIRCRS